MERERKEGEGRGKRNKQNETGEGVKANINQWYGKTKKKTFIQNDEKKVKPKKISERKNSGENTKEKKL